MSASTGPLAGLTAPELALLRILKGRTSKFTDLLGIRPESGGGWVSNAALLDATARGVFVLGRNEPLSIPSWHLARGPSFRQSLPGSLAWVPATFDAWLATFRDKSRSAMRCDWLHNPYLTIKAPAGTPKKVANNWWAYGCPVWHAARGLQDAGLLETTQHDGWTGTQPMFSLSSKGNSVLSDLAAATSAAESRIQGTGSASRPASLRMGALLLIAAEGRQRNGQPFISGGPEAPSSGSDDVGAARLSGWLADAVLVTAYENDYANASRVGKLTW